MSATVLTRGISRFAAATALALAALTGFAAAAKAGEITVYTAIEAEDLKRYAAAFNKAHPDVTIRWVRDSTGIITAKLLAEKANPQADAIMGLAATSLMLMKAENMLMPYAPAGVEKLDPRFVDTDTPPSWTGMDAWVSAICFNTIEAEKKNLPVPTSWKDLLNPVYKGSITMPNPNSSGTGFLSVSAWLQMMGEEDGWDYMDGLHENVAWYTHSGSKPCKQAAAGEVPIGISFAFRGAKLKGEGAPIEVIMASEGAGWDMEATAIVTGTDNVADAKKLVDWSVTKEANQLYNEGYAVVAYKGIAKPVPHFPANVLEAMIDNDFVWAAANRAAILAEWQKRYDSKSEAK